VGIEAQPWHRREHGPQRRHREATGGQGPPAKQDRGEAGEEPQRQRADAEGTQREPIVARHGRRRRRRHEGHEWQRPEQDPRQI
jgi:hypothetical protein